MAQWTNFITDESPIISRAGIIPVAKLHFRKWRFSWHFSGAYGLWRHLEVANRYNMSPFFLGKRFLFLLITLPFMSRTAVASIFVNALVSMNLLHPDGWEFINNLEICNLATAYANHHRHCLTWILAFANRHFFLYMDPIENTATGNIQELCLQVLVPTGSAAH